MFCAIDIGGAKVVVIVQVSLSPSAVRERRDDIVRQASHLTYERKADTLCANCLGYRSRP